MEVKQAHKSCIEYWHCVDDHIVAFIDLSQALSILFELSVTTCVIECNLVKLELPGLGSSPDNSVDLFSILFI